MKDKNKPTEHKKEIHYWIRPWEVKEYTQNIQELIAVGKEYDECQRIADENKDIRPRLFASDYYQIQNKGMTENFEVFNDPSLDNQRYDINKAKLNKYHAWRLFNRTPDEVSLDKIKYRERSLAITNMLKALIK